MIDKTKLLIKFDEKPAKNFGIYPEQRTLEELFDKGMINIDKDAGPTSHQVVDMLKKVLKIEKAGHSGTLDPKVTGVLLCGLGKATRLMEYMLKSNKEYICLMYLHKQVEEEEIKKTVKKFTGEIMQTPPLVSAVKRQERPRTIYKNEILSIKGQYVLLKVACQHGTYMRKLCSDIGEDLGITAQMVELRRTKAGPITENENIISLDKLRNIYELYLNSQDLEEKKIFYNQLIKYIQPMEIMLKDFKKVYVRNSAVGSLTYGSDLAIPGVSMLDDEIEMGEEIALMTLKGELIGMGTAFLSSKDVMKKDKGAFVKTSKIFMDREYYPKQWDFSFEY